MIAAPHDGATGPKIAAGDVRGCLLEILAGADRLRNHSSGERDADGRCEAELLRQVIDAQEPLPREGAANPLAGKLPDAIPMTGEEDPLAEVDDPEFGSIVAEFMRSERRNRRTGATPRARLAHALLPFADRDCAPVELLTGIEGACSPFIADWSAHEDARHPVDPILGAVLTAIITRALEKGRKPGAAPPLIARTTRETLCP